MSKKREREKEIGSCVVKGKVSLWLRSVASIFRSGELLDSLDSANPVLALCIAPLAVQQNVVVVVQLSHYYYYYFSCDAYAFTHNQTRYCILNSYNIHNSLVTRLLRALYYRRLSEVRWGEVRWGSSRAVPSQEEWAASAPWGIDWPTFPSSCTGTGTALRCSEWKKKWDHSSSSPFFVIYLLVVVAVVCFHQRAARTAIEEAKHLQSFCCVRSFLSFLLVLHCSRATLIILSLRWEGVSIAIALVGIAIGYALCEARIIVVNRYGGRLWCHFRSRSFFLLLSSIPTYIQTFNNRFNDTMMQ